MFSILFFPHTRKQIHFNKKITRERVHLIEKDHFVKQKYIRERTDKMTQRKCFCVTQHKKRMDMYIEHPSASSNVCFNE